MGLALMLAMQASAAPVAPPAPSPPIISNFDLARVRTPDIAGLPCFGAEPGTIVVCARRRTSGGYPLEQWERIFAEPPLIAETRLSGNVTGRAYTESVAIGLGQVSNRFMVGIRTPF